MKYMQQKCAILITGNVCPEYLDALIENVNCIPYKIASIWENENPIYVEKLKSNGFLIVISKLHEQYESNIPQLVPIKNGIEFAKNLDFDYVLKTRFDIISNDYNKYLDITQCKDKIVLLSGIHTSELYFLDIVVSGPINEMAKFYSLQNKNDHRFIEKFLLENYLNKENLTKDDIRKSFYFSLNICIDNSIEFVWRRSEAWKNELRTIPNMKVINEYCKDTFIWT